MATATHLINRTPSKVLDFSAPIDLLSCEFSHVSLKTNLSAKIFGCVVYVHVHNAGKLDHRSLKCIFLGYSTTQKGYKCYHPTSRKILVTANAKFDEMKMLYDRAEGQLDTFLQGTSEGEGSEGEDHSPTREISKQTPVISTVPSQVEEEESVIPEVMQAEEVLTDTDIPNKNRWPIAISKGVCECTKNKLYPISNYVSYSQVSPEYNWVIQALMTISVPRNV